MKNFLSIDEFTTDQLEEMLKESIELKEIYKKGNRALALEGRTLAMLFEKPSLRTRMSFQVAMTQLGGASIYVKPEDIGGIGKREPVKDIARVLSRYVDGIMARTFEHNTVVELAEFADIPVINALTDFSHPCQAMADMLTIKEHCGRLEGIKIAFVGDGNNVARSLAFACAKLGAEMILTTPEGYRLDEESVAKVNKLRDGTLTLIDNPAEAVKNADIIYTDTWVSMGQEQEKQQRIKDFEGFQINSQLLKNAPGNAKIMHCLPAYRGYEISDSAAESENCIMFDQAENRLHFQRALLKKLMS